MKNYKGYEIIPCLEYNSRQKIKYSQRCKEWSPEKGGFPQVAFYYFFNDKGDLRENGVVGLKDNTELWSPTELGMKRKITKHIKQYQHGLL